MKVSYLWILALVVFVLGCSKSEFEDKVDISNTHLPLAIGNSWVYAVDSLLITKNGSERYSSSTLLKEDIVSQDENQRYRVQRSVRKDTSEAWKIKGYYYLRYEDYRLIRTDVIDKIMLTYPLVDSTTWNALAYSTKDVIYNIIFDDITPYEDYFSSVVRLKDGDAEVVHMDRETVVEKYVDIQHFRKGVGVSKEIFGALYTQNNTLDVPFVDKTDYGFLIEKNLISYDIK